MVLFQVGKLPNPELINTSVKQFPKHASQQILWRRDGVHGIDEFLGL